jgi:hypothetical protein
METRSVGPMLKKEVTLQEVKDYMNEHYSYIENNMSDKAMIKFMKRPYIKGSSVERICNLLSDKLLASGAFAQE